MVTDLMSKAERESREEKLRPKNPSTHDMLTVLRTAIIADQFNPESPGRPAPEEIQDAHHIWALAAS